MDMYDGVLSLIYPEVIYPRENVTGACNGISASVEVELHMMMHTDDYL